MIDRIKALQKLDRKRLELTLMKIHARKPFMVCFNLFLLSINSLGTIKTKTKLILAKLGLINIESGRSINALEQHGGKFTNRKFAQDLSVLIVCETSIDQCFRYRVQQKLEQLEILAYRSSWINWTDYMEVKNQINFYDIIIFYRVPGYPKLVANIEYAKKLGKIVIYDVDDLVFDRDVLASYYQKSTGQLSAKELKAVLNGAQLYRKAISLCDYAITSTTTLQTCLAKVVGEENVFILPNSLDRLIYTVRSELKRVPRPNKISLFYGSGSKTHDQDFELIAPVLDQILSTHPDVELVLAGHLTVPDVLHKHGDRTLKLAALKAQEYLELLAHVDINLAPLTAGIFADCKSNIKWLEAAYLSVPTVASTTMAYQQTIVDGENGLLAESQQQWQAALTRLITDHEFRVALGQRACEYAKTHFSLNHSAEQFAHILSQTKQAHIQANDYAELNPELKHIVVVNVLYPPQAMGGATVVAENIVSSLLSDYADQYHVSIFTCDINNIHAHQVTEYEYKGQSVTAVSVPVGPDVDYREYDGQVGEYFSQFLAHKKPDLIHFHSIQRLTASMLDVADKLHIPFVTTVHDAWWLSDHQFLVDGQGNAVGELQANPIIAAQTSTDLQQSLARRKRLVSLLCKSETVLAVSEYQHDFYKKNGVTNIQLNKNGVNPRRVNVRTQGSNDKVVIGYTGSVCHHKGFYFLKQVVESHQLENIEFKVIDFSLSEPKQEQWNQTSVEYLPKFQAAEMPEFYACIDVLIAPSMWPESFGLITREAALAGLWVIASDAGGLAEEIEHGVNGFKFELGNESELADILAEINSNMPLYQQRVPQHTVERLDILTVEQQMHHLVAIYQCVCQKHRLASENSD